VKTKSKTLGSRDPAKLRGAFPADAAASELTPPRDGGAPRRWPDLVTTIQALRARLHVVTSRPSARDRGEDEER
jgi:hypothetical protein